MEIFYLLCFIKFIKVNDDTEQFKLKGQIIENHPLVCHCLIKIFDYKKMIAADE